MRATALGGPATRCCRLAALNLLPLITAACLDDDITGVRELSIVMSTGETSVTVGDSVHFDYSAEGTGLVTVWFEYGDGGADTVGFSGGYEVVDYGEPEDHANTDTLFYAGPLAVAGRLTHAFEAPGTFSVVGYAVGALGVATDTIRIAVN